MNTSLIQYAANLAWLWKWGIPETGKTLKPSDDQWFPKEGSSFKRWGCGLALPLPSAIAVYRATPRLSS